jgi:hypothetical protein
MQSETRLVSVLKRTPPPGADGNNSLKKVLWRLKYAGTVQVAGPVDRRPGPGTGTVPGGVFGLSFFFRRVQEAGEKKKKKIFFWKSRGTPTFQRVSEW